MLAALRGVLKECWRLGLMAHHEYARAAGIAAVRGQLPPRRRALNEADLEAGMKQQVIDQSLVLQSQRSQFSRHGEDDVHVTGG